MTKIIILLVALILSTNAFAWNKTIALINASQYSITNFYASNTGAGTWEEDILGINILAPNHYANINLEDGSGNCYFDFKVVTTVGNIYRTNVDVCYITTYTLY